MKGIQVGDTVRVLATGTFYGQVASVREVREKRHLQHVSHSYLLDVRWSDGQLRPSWFAKSEIEQVQEASK